MYGASVSLLEQSELFIRACCVILLGHSSRLEENVHLGSLIWRNSDYHHLGSPSLLCVADECLLSVRVDSLRVEMEFKVRSGARMALELFRHFTGSLQNRSVSSIFSRGLPSGSPLVSRFLWLLLKSFPLLPSHSESVSKQMALSLISHADLS